MTDFVVGHRVVLPADSDEGWEREHGYVVDVNQEKGLIMVRLDQEYLCGPGDDGLREVLFEHAELEKA